MALPQYYRTPKGNQALENRSIKLSSRQRALLLMIENGHTSHLSQQQLRQLATPDNLAILLEHQLIVAGTSAVSVDPQIATPLVQPIALVSQSDMDQPHEQQISANVSIQPAVDTWPESAHKQAIAAAQVPDLAGQDIIVSADLHTAAMLQATPDYLTFDDVKQLMMNSLREYCGLLASALIKDIQHASSITKLRMCQMRWVTTLTETRASSAQIAMWVEQINYSLSCPSEQVIPLSEALTL